MDRIVSVFAPLCDGLVALETNQIVHRDLKPSNVRVRPNGSPVIIEKHDLIFTTTTLHRIGEANVETKQVFGQ